MKTPSSIDRRAAERGEQRILRQPRSRQRADDAHRLLRALVLDRGAVLGGQLFASLRWLRQRAGVARAPGARQSASAS